MSNCACFGSLWYALFWRHGKFSKLKTDRIVEKGFDMKCYVCEKPALVERRTTGYVVVNCQYCDSYKISTILIDLMQGRKFPTHIMRKLLDERRGKLASTEPEPAIESWDEDLLEVIDD